MYCGDVSIKNHQIVYTFVVYHDIELLERKIKFLYTPEDLFIVHWNRYSSRKKLQQLQRIFKNYSNVHIYSKIKVIWGTNSILLAMIENMKMALQLTSAGGGQFEHLIVLSEQCVPVKTKEYIKSHLSSYVGKSFLGCLHFMPEIPLLECKYASDAFRLTRHYYAFQGGKKVPLMLCLQSLLYVGADLFIYALPIIKNLPETFLRACALHSSCALCSSSSLGKRLKNTLEYLIYFPYRLFKCALIGRETRIGNYGKKSALLSVCARGGGAISDH